MCATGPINQTNFDHIALYSNVGKRGVDVFAPGGEFEFPKNVDEDLILGACSASTRQFDCSDGLSYVVEAGSSPAAAQVSGEAAIIGGAGRQPNAGRAGSLHRANGRPAGQPVADQLRRVNVKSALKCPA